MQYLTFSTFSPPYLHAVEQFPDASALIIHAPEKLLANAGVVGILREIRIPYIFFLMEHAFPVKSTWKRTLTLAEVVKDL